MGKASSVIMFLVVLVNVADGSLSITVSKELTNDGFTFSCILSPGPFNNLVLFSNPAGTQIGGCTVPGSSTTSGTCSSATTPASTVTQDMATSTTTIDIPAGYITGTSGLTGDWKCTHGSDEAIVTYSNILAFNQDGVSFTSHTSGKLSAKDVTSITFRMDCLYPSATYDIEYLDNDDGDKVKHTQTLLSSVCTNVAASCIIADSNAFGQDCTFSVDESKLASSTKIRIKAKITGMQTTNYPTIVSNFIIEKSGLGPGAIAGIIIAVCVVVIAMVVILVILWKKKLLCFKGNKLGDLVWAKLERYPWWPGLVCNHRTELTHQTSGENPQIDVQFFDDPQSRAWIKAKNVKEFKGSDHANFKEGGLFFSLSKDIQRGAKRADDALKLTEEERLKLVINVQNYDDKNEEEFHGYKLGDLVWAKLEGYPWWPSLVCNRPRELTHQKSGKNPQIHVQFFDDRQSRAWIKAKNVKEFRGSDQADFKEGGLFFSLNEDVQKGAKVADDALKLTEEGRLKLVEDGSEKTMKTTKDKKIDRLSVVNEKAQKPQTPGHLTADTVARPQPGRPLPPKPVKKKKKKGSKKKRKKTKNEDGGEDSVKVPSIEKKEKNMEHYTENKKEYES